jgi:hypothetical protein
LGLTEPVEKTSKEIKRPSKLTNLQAAMGLANDKRLYSHCLVSFFFFSTEQLELEYNNHNRQPFEMSQRMQVYHPRVTGETEMHYPLEKWLKL